MLFVFVLGAAPIVARLFGLRGSGASIAGVVLFDGLVAAARFRAGLLFLGVASHLGLGLVLQRTRVLVVVGLIQPLLRIFINVHFLVHELEILVLVLGVSLVGQGKQCVRSAVRGVDDLCRGDHLAPLNELQVAVVFVSTHFIVLASG